MKDMEKFWKSFSEGLRSLGKGVGALADRLEEVIESQFDQEGSRQKSAKREAASHKKPASKVKKKSAAKKGQSATASDVVFELIKESGDGIGLDSLVQKSGLDRNKVRNTVNYLKKQGRVKSVARGKYGAT